MGVGGIFLSLGPVMGVGVYIPLSVPCYGCWGYILLAVPYQSLLVAMPSLPLSLVAISFWAQYPLITYCLASRAPPPMTELGTE